MKLHAHAFNFITSKTNVLLMEKILEEVKKLKDIPTTIIQGRYDMVCPPITAYELHQHMPHADFIMVPDAGHSASETSMTHELIKATNSYRTLS